MLSPMLSSSQHTSKKSPRSTHQNLLKPTPSNEDGDDFVRVPQTAVRGSGNSSKPSLSDVFFERSEGHRERNGNGGADGGVDVLYSALHEHDDPESGEAADGDGDGEEGMLSFLRLPSVSTFRASSRRTRTPTRTPTRDPQTSATSQYVSRADKLRMERLRRGFVWCSAVALAVGVVLLISVLAVRGRRRRSASVVGDSLQHVQPSGPGGCDRFYVEDVWTVGFPKRFSHSALRLVDVNRDGVPDVLFGYGTPFDAINPNELACEIYWHSDENANSQSSITYANQQRDRRELKPQLGSYFKRRATSRNRPLNDDAENSEALAENNNSEEKDDVQSQEAESPSSSSSSASQVQSCFGGVLALDGRDGHTLWEAYAGHEVHALTCEHDLNRDNVTDCVAAGLYGAFLAINAADGSILWTFSAENLRPHSDANMQMHMYTPQAVGDLNADGVVDFVQTYGGGTLSESKAEWEQPGLVLLVSGADGTLLRDAVETPDSRETRSSPQMVLVDGKTMVIFGTGGERTGGALYRIDLDDLKEGRINTSTIIARSSKKGFLTPGTFVDLNRDGNIDMVVVGFDGTVIAADLVAGRQLWNFTVPMGESFSYETPGVGYYNDDEYPDLMLEFAIGPGFPLYDYGYDIVLDGLTGRPLLERPWTSGGPAHTSPLSISLELPANLTTNSSRVGSLFVHWSRECEGRERDVAELAASANTSTLLRQRKVFATNFSQTRVSSTDTCALRFNTTSIVKAYVFGPSEPLPGFKIFDSEDPKIKVDGHRWWEDTAEDLRRYFQLNLKDSNLENVNGEEKWDKGKPRKTDKTSGSSSSRTQNSESVDRDENEEQSAEDDSDGLNAAPPAGHKTKPQKQASGRADKKLIGPTGGRPRPRRSVGAEDEGDVQQVAPSTGTLAPSFRLKEDILFIESSIDYIFTTDWNPLNEPISLTPNEKRCIKEAKFREYQRFDPKSMPQIYKYASMDHDLYQYATTLHCIRTSSKDAAIGLARAEKYRSASMRGANLVDLKAGQLVVYRCAVESLLSIPFLETDECFI